MLLFFQAAQQVADSLQVAADKLDQAIAQADGLDKLALVTQQLIGYTGRRSHPEGCDCLSGRTFSDPDAEPTCKASYG